MAKFVPATSQPTSSGGRFVPSTAVSSGGGRFVPATGATPHHAGGGGFDPFGLVENLASDVKDTITGLPRGVVATVEHPIGTAKAVGQAYAQTYGPLLRGHPLAFAKGVYRHPLGPILDVASVLTLGAGSIARAGSVLGKAGLIAETSRLARIAAVRTTVRTIALRSPRALAAEGRISPELSALIDQGAPEVLQGRSLSRNPLIQARQLAFDRALKRLPPTTWKLGEIPRYGKELDKASRAKAFTRQNELHRWHKAYDALNSDERIALDLIGRGLDPQEWKSVLQRSAAETQDKAVQRFVDKTAKVLDRPKVAELVANPSKNLHVAYEEGRRLSALHAGVLQELKLMTPEAALERPWLHKRIASGSRWEPTPLDVGQQGVHITTEPSSQITRAVTVDEAKARLAMLDKRYAGLLDQTARSMGLLTPEGKLSADQLAEQRRINTIVGGQIKGRGKQLRKGKQTNIKQQVLQQAEDALLRALEQHPDAPGMAGLAQFIAERDRLRGILQNPEAVFGGGIPVEELGTTTETLRPSVVDQFEVGASGGAWVGGKTIDELRAEHAAAGRLEPFYLPDRMVRDYVANPALARSGGGIAAAQKNLVYQNKAVLFQTGRLALGQDTLSPAYLRAVKYALFDDLHSALEEGAVRIPNGQGLPQGWVYLRRKLRGAKGAVKGERIPYTAQQTGQFERELERLIPDPGKPGETELHVEDLTTPHAEDAMGKFDYRLMIPQALAQQVAGEFTRSNRALRLFVEKPTQVWRAIILGYRPGFLVNNVVGNNLMLAIHFLGPAGAAAYVDMIRTAKGHETAAHLLRNGERSGLIDKQFIHEYFPEFAGAATFGRSQVPRFGPRGEKIARKFKLGIVPKTQSLSETQLRRVGVGAAIRHNPQVRAVLKKMPQQERSWRAAAEKAFAEDPRLIREVTDQVNAALGDYLALGPAERSYVRAAIPFWAWYRTIVTITAKLPFDHPARALLLVRLGEVGADLQQGNVPTYLQGAIPLGGLGTALLGSPPAPGTNTVLSTQGLNPFQTVIQVGTGARQLAVGDPGSAASTFGGELNPFAQAAIEQLTGQTLFSGGNVRQGPLPGLVGLPLRVGSELPFAQIGTGPSKLYPQRNERAQLLAILGIPVKRYSVSEAASRAALEKNPSGKRSR